MLAAHGLNVTRSFCFWPDFVPEPERLDGDVLDRFADFLDAHVERGLGTIPTFVVGHMSGQNWDPAWRDGRDLYRDAWLVSQQAWLAGELARRFGRHRAVVGWLVSNEMPLYGGPATAEEIEAWARLDRAGGAGRGRDAADLARRRRLGRGGDGARQRLLAADARPARRLRRAAHLPDAGRRAAPAPDTRLHLRARAAASASPSSSRSSASAPTSRPTTTLPTTTAGSCTRPCSPARAAGSPGATPTSTTCATRIRTGTTCSSSTSASPTRRGGRSRRSSSSSSSRRSSATSRTRGFERVAGEAAIVVPEHFERVLPFTEQSYRDDLRDNLLQGYVAAREADLPVELVRERDGISGGARLYLLPSVKALTGPGVDRLHRLASEGATVYASVLRRQHREPARPVARVVGGALRRPAPASLRPRRPHRGRRDRVRARRAARRPAGRRDARVPRDGRNAERPRLPAGRAGRRAGRRRRRPRPSGAPAPRARRGPHLLLHLPAGAPRCAHAAREPGEHLAPVLGARGRGGRVAARPRRRSPRARRARPEPRLPDARYS